MIYVATSRPIRTVQLLGELIAAGVPATVCYVTKQNRPRSVAIDVGDSWFVLAAEVIGAHTPDPDTIHIRVDELKRERRRRLDAIADDPDQIRLLFRLIQVVYKVAQDTPLDASDIATRDEVLAVRADTDAIDDAAKAIYQQLQSMTDAELAAYDVTTAPEWP